MRLFSKMRLSSKIRLFRGFTLSSIVLMSLPTKAEDTDKWFTSSIQPESLKGAHKAFLNGDCGEVAVNLKGLLTTPSIDQMYSRNGLDLLESCVQTVGNHISIKEERLPAELSDLKFEVNRRQNGGGGSFSIKLAGEATLSPSNISEALLTDANHQTILSKKLSIGDWELSKTPGEEREFEIALYDLNEPIDDGLYFIRFEFANGVNWNTWFILTGLNSSKTPKIVYPDRNAVIHSSSPIFRWENFVSPEYQNSERRGLWFSIYSIDSERDVFSKWESNPTRISTQSPTPLDNGQYQFYLKYSERRTFGAVKLGRAASSSVRFRIQK